MPRVIRPVAQTGVSEVDELLEGGLPVGAIAEVVELESSGRTGIALSFVNELTHVGKVCAWVDVSGALCPESAAATGVDLAYLPLGAVRSLQNDDGSIHRLQVLTA